MDVPYIKMFINIYVSAEVAQQFLQKLIMLRI